MRKFITFASAAAMLAPVFVATATPADARHRAREWQGADGRTYQLPLFSHAIEQHLELLEQNGLEVRAVREPAIAGDTRPVVVVLHAIKWPRGHS